VGTTNRSAARLRPPTTQLTPTFGLVHNHCASRSVRFRPYNTITDGNAVTRTGIANILGIWDYLKNSGLHPESKNMGLTWVGQVGGKREGRKDPRAQSPPSANYLNPTATTCQSRPCVWEAWRMQLTTPLLQIMRVPCCTPRVAMNNGVFGPN